MWMTPFHAEGVSMVTPMSSHYGVRGYVGHRDAIC
jgi:hypothetical protein